MGIKVANNAFGTLNTGITSSDTTIVLNTGEGVSLAVDRSKLHFGLVRKCRCHLLC